MLLMQHNLQYFFTILCEKIIIFKISVFQYKKFKINVLAEKI